MAIYRPGLSLGQLFDVRQLFFFTIVSRASVRVERHPKCLPLHRCQLHTVFTLAFARLKSLDPCKVVHMMPEVETVPIDQASLPCLSPNSFPSGLVGSTLPSYSSVSSNTLFNCSLDLLITQAKLTENCGSRYFPVFLLTP